MESETAGKEYLDELTRSAISVIRAPGRATVITREHPIPEIDRDDANKQPELELFHFGFSICSHKVRSVLAELNLEYGSNQYAGPTQYENYTPEYVRLRLQSDAAKNSRFVSDYSGGSAVESEGFDPLVVPTLVDHRANRVLADSKLICLYLVKTYQQRIDLFPVDLETEIIQQVDIVDQTPHVAMLYGADPEADTRPDDIQARMPGIHKIKFEAIKNHMANVKDEDDLITAYEAKLSKEKAAESFVVDEASMKEATALAENLVTGLEQKLARSNGPWLFGHRFTLADLMWGVSLIRLDYLGKSRFWNGNIERPLVKSYKELLSRRPSLKTAVLDWPGSGKRLQTD